MLSTLFKSPDAIVREIHNEIDTAQDRLLEQADSLLAELKIPTQTEIDNKAMRLKSIGFHKSEAVVKSEKLKETLSKNKEKYDYINDEVKQIRTFKQKYPFQKFLTVKELERICKKYNLIHAPISHYTKDVPEKNLTEIEKRPRLDNSELPKDKVIFKYDNDFTSEATYEQRRQLMKGIDITYNKHMTGSWRQSNDDVVREHFKIDYNVCRWESLYGKNIIESRQGLFIAAPKSHFDLTGLDKTSTFGFASTLIEPKDPIVFDYCGKNIVRVITKWGLEASDPALVNEQMN